MVVVVVVEVVVAVVVELVPYLNCRRRRKW